MKTKIIYMLFLTFVLSTPGLATMRCSVPHLLDTLRYLGERYERAKNQEEFHFGMEKELGANTFIGTTIVVPTTVLSAIAAGSLGGIELALAGGAMGFGGSEVGAVVINTDDDRAMGRMLEIQEKALRSVETVTLRDLRIWNAGARAIERNFNSVRFEITKHFEGKLWDMGADAPWYKNFYKLGWHELRAMDQMHKEYSALVSLDLAEERVLRAAMRSTHEICDKIMLAGQLSGRNVNASPEPKTVTAGGPVADLANIKLNDARKSLRAH